MSNPYITAASSDNTRKAYRSDIEHYERWGGRLPASTEMVIQYLQYFANTLNPRTLARRVTALKNWHVYQHLSDPTNHPDVTKTLIGIARVHGKPKSKAYPLLPEDLKQIATFLKKQMIY